MQTQNSEGVFKNQRKGTSYLFENVILLAHVWTKEVYSYWALRGLVPST